MKSGARPVLMMAALGLVAGLSAGFAAVVDPPTAPAVRVVKLEPGDKDQLPLLGGPPE
jgi:hypothetical protein